MTQNKKWMPLCAGLLLSFLLFLIRKLSFVDLDPVMILSPVIVISLLAYGESLLAYTAVNSVNLAGKLIKPVSQLLKLKHKAKV